MQTRNESRERRKTPAKARVFVVDDHPLVRRGLRILFGLHKDLVVCGEAEGEAEALLKINRCEPHLVVVDLVITEGDGFHLIQQLRQTKPAIKLLVFSMHNESSFVKRAMAAGADAFVPKDEGTKKVVSKACKLLFGDDAGGQFEPASARSGQPETPVADFPLPTKQSADLDQARAGT